MAPSLDLTAPPPFQRRYVTWGRPPASTFLIGIGMGTLASVRRAPARPASAGSPGDILRGSLLPGAAPLQPPPRLRLPSRPRPRRLHPGPPV
ncbi:MAG: hypothetical protein HZY74_12565 [Brevundimonas sp.]|nr:MAG: hypothetical protein HZY74_12565 [Brevundimonas sp.]